MDTVSSHSHTIHTITHTQSRTYMPAPLMYVATLRSHVHAMPHYLMACEKNNNVPIMLWSHAKNSVT